MKKALLLAFLWIALFVGAAWPQAAAGQEREAWIDRILNPLPDFDPFERAPTPPKFFPDEVDKRARQLLVDALTGNDEALQDHGQFFRHQDARLRRHEGSSTGLADHAQDLANNTIREREGYLAAQRRALANGASPERKKYLQSLIDNDDLSQADQLLHRSSVNRWAGVFNRMLGSVDLAGVASGNYIGAAAETAIGQIYALLSSEMPIEQRRALARQLEHLKRYPDDARNPAVLKEIEDLERKKNDALAQKQLDHARQAANKGDWDRAVFHAEIAGYFAPDSKAAQDELQRVSRLYLETVEHQRLGLGALPEQPAPAQQGDTRALLEALSLRDAEEVMRQAAAMETKYRGDRLADAARDAASVALEMQGRHDEAKKIIEQLARSAAPEGRQRAAALLASKDYNLLANFNQARSERRLESIKYVLLGEDLLKKNLLYAAGALAAAGPAGAVTLGAANALMLGNNLVNVLTNNPVSVQPIIDAGVAYVRSHPESGDAAEVYRVVAEAYEERGMIDKAISYHQLAGSSGEKISSLKEKAANVLLGAAAKGQVRGTREHYLTAIIDHYPESTAAAEATKKLAELAKSENQGLRMSKRFLMDNPEVAGPGGLGLKASLFDGNVRNMELADRGIALGEDNELLIHYQTPAGVRSQSYGLSSQATDRFFAALRQKNHQVALADADRRVKGSVGGIRNLPLPVVQGARTGIRDAGEDRDETTFSFVREAGGRGPAYPRVLDHELLSENERDPGSKYKLPPIQGSISASRFSMSGALPAGLWGNQIGIGADSRGSFAGVQLPIPLLQNFVPVDFLVHGRPGGVSIYPKIHGREDNGEDRELYK